MSLCSKNFIIGIRKTIPKKNLKEFKAIKKLGNCIREIKKKKIMQRPIIKLLFLTLRDWEIEKRPTTIEIK
tara:strand:- start:125 stop:337 length:213 start_codon:yes stop_codon:yes gene_type:complete